MKILALSIYLLLILCSVLYSGEPASISDAAKSIKNAMNQKGADVTLQMDMVFYPQIVYLEDANIPPFGSCKVFSNPRLPVDFGLSSEIKPGMIDTIKQSWLSGLAQSNAFIDRIADADEIKQYKNCLAYYGAVIGQAYLYLQDDLKRLKAGNKKANIVDVNGIGYDDLLVLAADAINRSIKEIKSEAIKNIYERIINDNSRCQFDKTIENIKCGNVMLQISSKPQLTVANINWYGNGYAGLQGSFKVSKAWSYTSAYEYLRQTAGLQADQVEEYEKNGQIKQALLTKKAVVDKAIKGGK